MSETPLYKTSLNVYLQYVSGGVAVLDKETGGRAIYDWRPLRGLLCCVGNVTLPDAQKEELALACALYFCEQRNKHCKSCNTLIAP